MYHENYLGEALRAASLGADQSLFLQNHQTDDAVTYQAFFANAERMAQVLVETGVAPGDKVAVQAPKTVDVGALCRDSLGWRRISTPQPSLYYQ